MDYVQALGDELKLKPANFKLTSDYSNDVQVSEASYYDLHENPMVDYTTYVSKYPVIAIDCSYQLNVIKESLINIKVLFNWQYNVPSNVTIHCVLIMDDNAVYNPLNNRWTPTFMELVRLTDQNGGQVPIAVNPMPLPRKGGVIKFEFTPRVFPTPSRESRNEEEQQWLSQQKSIRDASGVIVEDLDAEQKNIYWLTSKGRSLMEDENYLAATNIFTYCIDLEPNLPDSYLNRSAAHLKLNNLHKTIEDATKALELLATPTKSNAALRAKAHELRGSAIMKLGEEELGSIDLEAAVKITNERDIY